MHGSTWSMRKERRSTGSVWMTILRSKRHTRWRRHNRHTVSAERRYRPVASWRCSVCRWWSIRCGRCGNKITYCLTVRWLTTSAKTKDSSDLELLPRLTTVVQRGMVDDRNYFAFQTFADAKFDRSLLRDDDGSRLHSSKCFLTNHIDFSIGLSSIHVRTRHHLHIHRLFVHHHHLHIIHWMHHRRMTSHHMWHLRHLECSVE